MKDRLRRDAEDIARSAINAVLPDEAIKRALSNVTLSGRVYLVSIGKAGWQMADAAVKLLDRPIEKGIVVTKYDHAMGSIEGVECYEAGHPVPDENSFKAAQAVLDMTSSLSSEDTVLFLISGGGSALFEKALVDLRELQDITGQLLSKGADIVEINTIRKRLSAVKGGRFAKWCSPARVEAVILSDILGDPMDMIASGPAAADPSTCEDALAISKKYDLKLSLSAKDLLCRETPKELDNVHSQVIGSVRELCTAAERKASELGYKTVYLTDLLDCEAKDAGRFMGSILKSHCKGNDNLAFIAGGETVVHLTGKGLGGRNQELALAAAKTIKGLRAALISVGSDGTDGPTDAAGGYVDGDSFDELEKKGLNIEEVLKDNDAYHALKAIDGLIMTGPTGTNVNDLIVGLCRETI